MKSKFYINATFGFFIRALVEKSYREIIEILDFKNAIDYKSDYEFILEFFLYKDSEWVHFFDNEIYEFHFSRLLRNKLLEFSEKYDVYLFSVGDVDKSFDFKYYSGGKIVRDYEVKSPNYNDQVVATDFGKPLGGEEKAFSFREEDELSVVLTIAESLGIQLPTKFEQLNEFNLKDFM